MSGADENSASSDSSDSTDITEGLGHCIWELLVGAELLRDAVFSKQPTQRLIPLAAKLQPLLNKTIVKGLRMRRTLPERTLPELADAGCYLNATIRAIERGLPRWRVEMKVKALVETLEELL
jgi:hypothetical protein